VVTGKGGVGKTVISIALCLYLKSQGRTVYYNGFDQLPDQELLRKLGIEFLPFTVNESAEIYVGNKLGSRTLGNWVMRAPFFKALFQMMPGLASMILLGHIIKTAEDNPEASIVIDSPSTGHARVLFESTQNYKEMFGSGLIVDDIKKMQSFLSQPNHLRTVICSLPSELPLEEGKELFDYLKHSKYQDVSMILNDSLVELLKNENIILDDIPKTLRLKIEQEMNLLRTFGRDIELIIPKITDTNRESLIHRLSYRMAGPAYGKH
jgi:anion-transporting  ArsA/GET3 family ATPase